MQCRAGAFVQRLTSRFQRGYAMPPRKPPSPRSLLFIIPHGSGCGAPTRVASRRRFLHGRRTRRFLKDASSCLNGACQAVGGAEPRARMAWSRGRRHAAPAAPPALRPSSRVPPQPRTPSRRAAPQQPRNVHALPPTQVPLSMVMRAHAAAKVRDGVTRANCMHANYMHACELRLSPCTHSRPCPPTSVHTSALRAPPLRAPHTHPPTHPRR
jgi:hypothetical protein